MDRLISLISLSLWCVSLDLLSSHLVSLNDVAGSVVVKPSRSLYLCRRLLSGRSVCSRLRSDVPEFSWNRRFPRLLCFSRLTTRLEPSLRFSTCRRKSLTRAQLAEIVLSQYFILTEVALTVTFVNTDMVGWVFQCFFFCFSPTCSLSTPPPPTPHSPDSPLCLFISTVGDTTSQQMYFLRIVLVWFIWTHRPVRLPIEPNSVQHLINSQSFGSFLINNKNWSRGRGKKRKEKKAASVFYQCLLEHTATSGLLLLAD